MIIIIINNKIIINKLNRGQNSDDFRHLSLFFKHINGLETLNSDFSDERILKTSLTSSTADKALSKVRNL